MTDLRLPEPGERTVTLIDYAVGHGGVLRGGRVLSFMIAWQTAQNAAGDDWPDTVTQQVVAYSAYWKQSERTGWRELKRFRDVFAGEESPSRVMALATAARQAQDAPGIAAAALATA